MQPLYSDRTYDIEFRGYLSNHSKHGVVALSGLGAPMTRVREWWDDHTSMTEYGWCLEPAVPARKVGVHLFCVYLVQPLLSYSKRTGVVVFYSDIRTR